MSSPELPEAFAPIHRPQGGGMQALLTAAEIAWAIEERRKGRTTEELAAQLHVHPSTVSRWTTRYGGAFRRHLPVRRMDPESLLHTMQLAGQGYSVRDIATLQGLHPTSVRYRLRLHARDQSWRNRPDRLTSHTHRKGA